MDFNLIFTSGALTIFVLEGIKWAFKKLFKKPTDYAFPAVFYVLAVPCLNVIEPFALVALGMGSADPVLTMPAVEIARLIIKTAIASLISFAGYNTAIKALKEKYQLERAQQ